MNNRITSSKAKKCVNSQHSLFRASLICTYDHCDYRTRYLCVQCQSEKIHQHNQQEDKHIMDLQSLVIQILKILSDQQIYRNHLEHCLDHFSDFQDSVDKQKINDVVRGNPKLMIRVKSEILNCVLDYIQKNMPQLSLDFICEKCFNSEDHDHQQYIVYFDNMKAQIINLQQNNFTQYILKFKDIIQSWLKKDPIYNKEKIKTIYDLKFKNSDFINQQHLENLVFIRNSVYNISQINSAFLDFIEKELINLNSQIQEDMLIQQDETLNILGDFFEKTKYTCSVRALQTKDKLSQNYQIVSIKLIQGIKYLFCGSYQGHLFCFKIKQVKKIFQRNLYQSRVESILPINNQEVITISFDAILIITNYKQNRIITRIQILPFRQKYNLFSIEYDQNQRIIYILMEQFYIIERKNLRLHTCTQSVQYEVEQLQLVQNKTHILSKSFDCLELWKIQEYNLQSINIYKFNFQKFKLMSHNSKIILIDEYLIQLLDENLNLQKILIYHCFQCYQPKRIKKFPYKDDFDEDYPAHINFYKYINMYHQTERDYQIMLPIKKQIVQHMKLLIQSGYQ